MDRNLNLRAVLLGYFTDLLTTILFSLGLTVVLLDPGSGSTCLAERIDARMLDQFMLCWGLFFTGLGGFVAARRAGCRPYLHAGLVGLLSLWTSVTISPDQTTEVGSQLMQAGVALTMPVALLGGRLSRLWR